MSENSKNNIPSDDWSFANRPPKLTADQTLEWLEGMREFFLQVYRNNPEWAAKFEKDRWEGKPSPEDFE